MQRISGNKWNEPLSKMMLCLYWDWKGFLYYALVLVDGYINSNKYSSQLDQMMVSIDEKHPELVEKGYEILTSCHIFLWWSGKICYNLDQNFTLIYHIQKNITIRLPFILKNYLMKKKQLSEKLQMALRQVFCWER